MMKLSPLAPEITKVINAPFWIRTQKSEYLTEYLNNYWTDVHETFSFGRRVYGHYKNDISFTVVQRTL